MNNNNPIMPAPLSVTMYFVTPREGPRRQRIPEKDTHYGACNMCFLTRSKKEHRDWRIKDASRSMYPWARLATSRPFLGWDKYNSLFYRMHGDNSPGGQSGMRAYTCATRKPRKRFSFFFKTTCDACDAFRGAKSLFFRKRGVSNFSGVAIRVMFLVL